MRRRFRKSRGNVICKRNVRVGGSGGNITCKRGRIEGNVESNRIRVGWNVRCKIYVRVEEM